MRGVDSIGGSTGGGGGGGELKEKLKTGKWDLMAINIQSVAETMKK